MTGDQIGLFGQPAGSDRPVEPAAVDAEAAAVAARLPGTLRLGTSSWSFPGWAGLVYHGAASESKLAHDGLAAYAANPMLRTVGLDRTFYKPEEEATLRRLARQTGDGFRFLVKAWQGITRPDADERGRTQGDTTRLRDAGGVNPMFLDAEAATDLVIGRNVRGLGVEKPGDRLGPVLFQFPPLDLSRSGHLGGPAAFLDRLEAFLATLPGAALVAVEVRNRELFEARHAARLAGVLQGARGGAGAALGFAHHPALPTVDVQRRAMEAAGWPVERQPAMVCRWLLRHDQTYQGAKARYGPFDRIVDPDDAARGAIVGLALAAMGAGRPGWIIVNNKAEGSAPRSVLGVARGVVEGI